MFLEYLSEDRLMARIQDPRGKTYIVLVMNFVPMHALTHPARLVALEAEYVGVYPLA